MIFVSVLQISIVVFLFFIHRFHGEECLDVIKDFFVFVFLSSLNLTVILQAPASPAKPNLGFHLLTAIRSSGRLVGQSVGACLY